MKKSDPEKSSILESVAIVSSPWAQSTYYEDAERWSFIFWENESVFRRLFDRLDLTSVVELACGHGRHAEKIVDRAKRLILIDVFDESLAFCADRLDGKASVSYIKGDGYTFRPISDNSISSVFCYDAMVHFSQDIVESYLLDACRILVPGGMGLFHHSNYLAPLDRHYGLNPHARNHMTSELFGSYAEKAGLNVLESRIIAWGGVDFLDCISLVQRPV